MKKHLSIIALLIVISIINSSCIDINFDTDFFDCIETQTNESPNEHTGSFDIANLPDFTDNPYVEINNNAPYFTENDYLNTSFEIYSDLDRLGRCGVAFANVGPESIPTEERGAIGQIKPSGWHTVKYDCVEGKYLYNRCHLIAYNLCGENSNEKNLVTGTRYMNISGMLPFEIKVYDYVVETGNHVLYRVTPIYDGDNLLASGVLMEGWSVEDEGEGICFNAFVYNAQPEIEIDYATGESRLVELTTEYLYENSASGSEIYVTEAEAECSTAYIQGNDNTENSEEVEVDYILNTNSYKFHFPNCDSVKDMSERNKKEYIGNRADLIEQGFVPCKICKP